jgi:hypothetical protein
MVSERSSKIVTLQLKLRNKHSTWKYYFTELYCSIRKSGYLMFKLKETKIIVVPELQQARRRWFFSKAADRG